MTYGDEQAEARRLHSILNEGDDMTPASPPTPLDALAQVNGQDSSSEEIIEGLAEQGYVLVNADMLADAMYGMPGMGATLESCRKTATVILVALQAPASEATPQPESIVAATKRIIDTAKPDHLGRGLTDEQIEELENPASPAAPPAPALEVLTGIIEDTPAQIIEGAKGGNGEGMAAWIVSQWAEYARLSAAAAEGTE